MRISKILALAMAVCSMLLIQPSESLAKSKKAAAQTVSWDGTWSGKFNGRSAGRIIIRNNRVISYSFRGRPQTVGSTRMSGRTIRFGSGYSITMTMTGANSASAVWRGDGTAQADMTR